MFENGMVATSRTERILEGISSFNKHSETSSIFCKTKLTHNKYGRTIGSWLQ